MEQGKLPRVLVVDVNAWREDAGSNTLLEVFRCWNSDSLALIYTSSEFPNTEVCGKFFQIGENQVLKSVLKPWMRVGREVQNTPTIIDDDVEAERKLRSRAHRLNSKWIRLAREIVWKLGHWRTAELERFIDQFKPDLLFVPIFPYAYMGRIQKHIIRLAKKPVVCYLADDNYSYDACSSAFDYILRYWNRKYVKLLATHCVEMFVIVDKEKEDTDLKFGTDSVILTKGVDFTNRTFTTRIPKNPLKFVYTGSLLIGRGTTLGYVADAINEINEERNELIAELFVYSQTIPTDEVLSHIDSGASHFCGSVPRQEIQTILDDADVVVFAEALNGKDANVAKLSFSTKITDYLSCGKCILAIGKNDIAPIDYLRRYDSALIAVSKDDINNQVRRIIGNPTLINDYGRAAFECSRVNHEKDTMNRRFISTMLQAYKTSKS